jgi:hypothetical protein
MGRSPIKPNILLFRKNIQFSRLIKAGSGLKEFNFRKPNGLEGSFYEVDVSDDRGNRVYFRMQLIEELWKLQETLLPSWVILAEPLLQEAILEEEKVI